MSKKFFNITVLLIGLILILAACGGNDDGASAGSDAGDDSDLAYELDPDTPAWELDQREETTELTWYVNADWWNDDWGNDTVTQQMEKDLNVKINFIKGDDTNLNTMFASEDMADIVTIFDANSQVAEQADSWAYSLNDLADQYDPHWYQVAAEDTMNWFQLDDGKTYGYPNYSNSSEDYDNDMIPAGTAFLIRKDIYEAIGEPSLGTPEEFRSAMQSINENYPDVIPFGFNALEEGTGSLGGAFQDFLGVPITTDDGEFYDRNLDEDYLTWLRTLREVRSDGNISDDSFADDGTAFEEKVKSGQYATIMAEGTAQMGGFLQAWYSENPDAQYIAIDGPQSTVGEEPKLNQSGVSGWMINYISQSASDPAKAMQIFTYLQSEYGGMLTTYGIEGETFQYDADGQIELLPEVQEMKDSNPDQFKEEYRLSEFIFFGHDKYLLLESEKNATPALTQLREWGEGKLYPQFVLENTNPDQGTPEARNLSAIDTSWETTLVSLIRANSDQAFDEALDAYRTFLDQNGWDEIVEIRNQKIAENQELLGLN
ncbi:sugar ABC transporter substrate-binding protein [Amphibacillus sp. Q70]|uniref:sugar ABC transporter substrate-binding protein n=1 Tax=Amphibacillus sp. Q70 TaxID=3453416 RepID=UPI003F852B26